MIIDLCGAPGGWSQYVLTKLSKNSKVILIDLARVKISDENCFCFQEDITSNSIIDKIHQIMSQFNPPFTKADLVISDCAPKMGGNYATDHARQIYLVSHAFRIAVNLKAEKFLAKVFDGSDFPNLKILIKKGYKDLRIYKPKASRSESAELYILAQGLVEDYVPPEDF